MNNDGKTLLGSYVYTRIMLIFQVDPEALGSRLPEGWELAPEESDEEGGLSANLGFGFCYVLASQDAEGELKATPAYHYLPFNGPARSTETGEVANIWYHTYATEPAGMLGWGEHGPRLARRARFQREVHVEADDLDITVEQQHLIEVEGGGEIRLAIEYKREQPEPVRWERPIRYPERPQYALYFENDDLQHAVFDPFEDVDRRLSYEFQTTVPEVADLFDGGQELRAIYSAPWSRRTIYRMEGAG